MKSLGCFILLTLHAGYLTAAAGNHADNNHHLCKDLVCYNDGHCKVDTIHHELVAYCECKHEFIGQHCEAQSCHDIQCQNGGKCHEHQVDHTYKEALCNCPNGYTGSRCENGPVTTASSSTISTSTDSATSVSTTTLHSSRTDPCASSPCTQHGICKIAANGVDFKCHCILGYHGQFCERDACDKHNYPCHNGTCVLQHEHPYFRCVCPHGYIGNHCKLTICDTGICNNGSCQLLDILPYFSCQCDNGFTGNFCEVPVTTFTPSTTISTNTSQSLISENACHQNKLLCGNGTCVTQSAHPYYRCTCPYGYIGLHCEMTVCDTGLCNNGSCQLIDILPYFSCQCGNGFTGNFCEVPVTETSHSTVSTPTPITSAATLQSLSENACHQNKLLCGNGTCVTQSAHPYYRCTCPYGYIGLHCEMTVCDTGLCNNGSCQLIDILPYFSCQCGNGFTGNFCEVPVTETSHSTVSTPTPITSAATLQSLSENACHQNKLLCGNGTCVTQSAHPYYRCTCPYGYIGLHCEMTVCDTGLCNNGSCQLIDILPYFSCQCGNGFTGNFCEVPVTATSHSTVSTPTPVTSAATLQSLTDACNQNKPDCGNGTCVTQDAPPYYKCVCDSGYIGPQCDHNVCDIDPCKNGICQPLDITPYFSCQCNFGFTGILCEAILNPTSTPPFSVSSTTDLGACDKFSILTDVAKGVSVENNMTTCQSGSHASPEAFVINNCNVTSSNSAWKSGIQVMDACHGGTALPTYSPVGIFFGGSYLDSLSGGTAGVFLGCLADGGFKLGVQDCDSTPVIKHINGSHFTMDPSMYFSIV